MRGHVLKRGFPILKCIPPSCKESREERVTATRQHTNRSQCERLAFKLKQNAWIYFGNWNIEFNTVIIRLNGGWIFLNENMSVVVTGLQARQTTAAGKGKTIKLAKQLICLELFNFMARRETSAVVDTQSSY